MSINVIHCTDLYRPHSDFDDVADAMAMFALHCMREINLLAFVLDQPAEQQRRPGKITVDELNAICETSVPSITGYHALLNLLQAAPNGIVMTIVGGLSDLYWAYKTNPGLVKQKLKEVWVFAGDAQEQATRYHEGGRDIAPPYGLEHNVNTDVEAFREIMRSDLKIVWIPCYDGGEVRNPDGSANPFGIGPTMLNASFFMGQYEHLLSKSSPQVLDFFVRALSTEGGPGFRYDWNVVKKHFKEFWGVGIFQAITQPNGNYPFKFVQKNILVNENATIRVGSGNKQVLLFERTDKSNYFNRMTSLSAELFSHIGKVQDKPAPPREDEDIMGIKKPDLSWSSPLVPITSPIVKLVQHHMAHITWTIFDVHAFHRDSNGWKGVGYNYWIAFDGTIYEARGRNVGAHAGANWNGRSLGVGYQGNFETQQMTDAQVKSGAWLNAKLAQEEGLTVDDIIGHKDISATLCPGKNFRMAELRQETAKLLGGGSVGTPIKGAPQVTVRQAQKWALDRNAEQRFIDIAPVYWQYGEQVGIRPEVLYAQSAKETAFGRYGGAVTPEMNNWAGIKILSPSGDKREDHETFATPQDGVRGHFNHITAYVGLEPVGETHPRYSLVKRLAWAGTITTVEQLGERWAPAANYGESIVQDYLWGLWATEEPGEPITPPPGEPEPCANCAWLQNENNRLLVAVSDRDVKIAGYRDRLRKIEELSKGE